MRVVFDHSIFGLQPYGGVSRYFFEVTNHLARMGNNVEIFSPLYVNEYFHDNCAVRPRGFRIGLKTRRLGRIVSAINTGASLLFVKTRRHVDIFHETYFTTSDCCPGSAKRVLTVYDMIYERYPRYFSPLDRTPQLKEHAVKRADHVICISENTRRDLIELLGVPEEKTSVVYLGYSLDANKAPSDPPRKGKPFILYVGSRWGYKNFDRMVKAYGSSKVLKDNLSLVCFGGGPFNSEEWAMFGSLQIPRDDVMHVSGNDDVLAGLYSSASLFVYPSLYEGFGIPPLEAMFFGCPVACANSSSLPEVVGEAAELFDPNDEDSMRCAMERVISEQARSRELVRSGKERIKLFSWEKCAADTLEVYRTVLGVR
ncbi:MAG: glycosyltransferase family 4 protein [Syntrophorhabdus sp.]|nr:glycosyltransferase family 4 protein [Syntrophorhabdus sp.]